MNTILLNPATWDMTTDADGNIAVATEPYSLSQDVASACRLFQGELYYDTSQGVPYWQGILGQLPPLQFIKNAYVTAALTVTGIKRAVCFITQFKDRVLRGQIQTTDKSGNLDVTGF